MHTVKAFGTVAYLEYKDLFWSLVDALSVYIVVSYLLTSLHFTHLQMYFCLLVSNSCRYSLNLGISRLRKSPGKIIWGHGKS